MLFTLDAAFVVTLSIMMFWNAMSKQFFVWQSGATESTVQQTLGHQPFHFKSLIFRRDVLRCLAVFLIEGLGWDVARTVRLQASSSASPEMPEHMWMFTCS